MKKLTKKQAIELSIKKWEYIVGRNGRVRCIDIISDLPDLAELNNYCGLCEKYMNTSGAAFGVEKCIKCPLCISTQKRHHLGCNQPDHPFENWDNYETKEYAQAVLDLIKSIPYHGKAI
jgi:hypothetical protein